MTAGAFPFLRSTFYRWAQTFPKICPDLAKRPSCWPSATCTSRTSEPGATPKGGLIWGVNDFDEAHEMPYTLDLVRLAVSAHLAEACAAAPRPLCEAILDG